MGRKEHTIRDNVIAGLIYTIIGAIILSIGAYFIPSVAVVLHWCRSLLAGIWGHLNSDFAVPRWIAYCAGIYILFRVVNAVRRFINETPEPIRPDYAQYTQDTFEGMVWRWRYTSDYSGIADLQAYCAKCDTLLSTESWVTFVQLVCEHCGQEYFLGTGSGSISLQNGLQGLEGRVRRLIDRKIRNNEWKTLLVADEAGKTENNQ